MGTSKCKHLIDLAHLCKIVQRHNSAVPFQSCWTPHSYKRFRVLLRVSMQCVKLQCPIGDLLGNMSNLPAATHVLAVI